MPTEPVLEAFERYRNEYRIHLKDTVAAQRVRHPELVTELPMRINGECPNERLLYVRIDIVWGNANDPQLMNAELAPIASGRDEGVSEFVFEQVVVRVSRFRWHSCTVRMNSEPCSWSPIWEWFDTWFDLEGRHEPDDDGFEDVVHGLSYPDFADDGGCSFTVDFGSARSDCVIDLIQACAYAGVKEMTLA